MAVTKVGDRLSVISKGGVNAFLLDAPDGLTLIDTGNPGTDDAILGAVAGLGRAPSDLRHILLTHAHPDHFGSAAALARATGARVLIHPADRAIAERGAGFRPMKAPGLLSAVLFRLFVRAGATTEPVAIAGSMEQGEALPIAGGLEVVHVPGHCAGQVALLWRPERTLFTADACTNLFGLCDPVGFEDEAEGRRSQLKLARLDFDTACFGHGKPMVGGAAARFRRRWTELPDRPAPRRRNGSGARR